MKKEISKAYEPSLYEDEIYKNWEEGGFFNPDNLDGDPYSIMMPPPNVTGVLHLGHALENSLMDVMVRYQRMNGKKALLLPGTDHAAVATQAKVEKILQETRNIKNPREELGRDGLLKEVRAYAENSKATILKQVRKMGTSCDWSRLSYTFSDELSRAVNEIFVRMYRDGLIYRGYRVINWTVKGQSTCSDDELEYIERQGKIYTFRYGKDFPISIATTRPETKLGDTAVAVNPTDERYSQYIGRTFTLDVGAQELLKIKVIADESVDPAFGTGAVGVTPAHSMVDFEMYERQRAKNDPIDLIQVIGTDGKMTVAAGKNYEGLDVLAAREKFVAWLKENDLLEKEEEVMQSVGVSDRYKDVVEAIPMTQWFVAVNREIPGRGKSLKDLMREAATTGHNGDVNEKITINPVQFEKIYFNWIDNLRDWCISRQIWWGHRIPVWYRGESKVESRKSKVERWDFKIYGEDIYNDIQNGGKIFETRIGRERSEVEKNWEDLRVGDLIDFSLVTDNDEQVLKTGLRKAIKNIFHFGSIDEMLSKIEMGKISSTSTVAEYKNWAEGNFAERLEKHGVWAFELGDAEEDIYVGVEAPAGDGWVQDEDTLDTWFSSGLWTFSTLGWPDETVDLKTFHPTSWMQMGHEILFFWMARMILMSTYALDMIPFRDVYIHGVLRDAHGNKFSKSSGNNIDPIEVIGQYGTDALRLSLLIGISPGQDSKYYEEKVAGSRNFINKLWNISRFVLGNADEITIPDLKNLASSQKLTLADKWILSKFNNLIQVVSSDLERYRFSQAGESLRDFTWSDLADWYLEASKFESHDDKNNVLIYILSTLLKLWHPFIPFVTEVIWDSFNTNKLIVAKWPVLGSDVDVDEKLQIDFEIIKEIISSIRNARSENKVEPAKKIRAIVYAGSKKELIESQAALIRGMKTGIDDLQILESGSEIEDAIYVVVGEVKIYLLGAVDKEKDAERIRKEVENLEKMINNTKNKLNNAEFVERAPKEIVEREKRNLENWEKELENLRS